MVTVAGGELVSIAHSFFLLLLLLLLLLVVLGWSYRVMVMSEW